jgi:hypothetical protein
MKALKKLARKCKSLRRRFAKGLDEHSQGDEVQPKPAILRDRVEAGSGSPLIRKRTYQLSLHNACTPSLQTEAQVAERLFANCHPGGMAQRTKPLLQALADALLIKAWRVLQCLPGQRPVSALVVFLMSFIKPWGFKCMQLH